MDFDSLKVAMTARKTTEPNDWSKLEWFDVSPMAWILPKCRGSPCKGTQVFPMQFEWIQREVNWSWGTQVKVLFQVLSSECFCQLESYNNVYLAGVLQSISKSRFLWHCLPHRAGGGRQRETPPAMLQLVAKLLFSLSPPKQFDNSDNECVAWKGTRRSSDTTPRSGTFTSRI